MSLRLACQDASFLGRILACLSYGGVSVSITMFNKAVFSLYGFNYPNFVTTLQILVSILYMAILGCLGWFKFSRFTLRAARQVGSTGQVSSPWLPLSLGRLRQLVHCRVLCLVHGGCILPRVLKRALASAMSCMQCCCCCCADDALSAVLVAVCGLRRDSATLPHGAHVQVRLCFCTASTAHGHALQTACSAHSWPCGADRVLPVPAASSGAAQRSS